MTGNGPRDRDESTPEPPLGDRERENESPISPLDAAAHAEDPPLRERLRNRLGLTSWQWTVLVSVVTFLPYPVFLYLMLYESATSIGFLLLTLAYSLVAVYANFVL